MRDTSRIAAVVQGHDIFFQEPVQGLAVYFILGVPITVLGLTEGPAIRRSVLVTCMLGLWPPTIQHAKVVHPIHF